VKLRSSRKQPVDRAQVGVGLADRVREFESVVVEIRPAGVHEIEV